MPNTKSYAVGWGATSYGGSTSRKLRNVRLNIYDGEMCSKFANTDWTKQMLNNFSNFKFNLRLDNDNI